MMFAFDSVPAIIRHARPLPSSIPATCSPSSACGPCISCSPPGKRYLRHLKKSVVIILAYIGVKMLLDVVGIVHYSPLISLGVVIGLLAIGILASPLPESPPSKFSWMNDARPGMLLYAGILRLPLWGHCILCGKAYPCFHSIEAGGAGFR